MRVVLDTHILIDAADFLFEKYSWEEAVQMRTPTPDGQNWLFGPARSRRNEKPNSNCARRGGLVYNYACLGTQNGNTG